MKKLAIFLLSFALTGAAIAQTLTAKAVLQVAGGVGRSVTANETPTGNNFDFRQVAVTTGGELTMTIDTDVGDAGYCFLYNPSTNYIEIGFASSNYVLRLRTGQTGLVPLDPATATLYLRSENETSNCEVFIYEE